MGASVWNSWTSQFVHWINVTAPHGGRQQHCSFLGKNTKQNNHTGEQKSPCDFNNPPHLIEPVVDWWMNPQRRSSWWLYYLRRSHVEEYLDHCWRLLHLHLYLYTMQSAEVNTNPEAHCWSCVLVTVPVLLLVEVSMSWWSVLVAFMWQPVDPSLK